MDLGNTELVNVKTELSDVCSDTLETDCASQENIYEETYINISDNISSEQLSTINSSVNDLVEDSKEYVQRQLANYGSCPSDSTTTMDTYDDVSVHKVKLEYDPDNIFVNPVVSEIAVDSKDAIENFIDSSGNLKNETELDYERSILEENEESLNKGTAPLSLQENKSENKNQELDASAEIYQCHMCIFTTNVPSWLKAHLSDAHLGPEQFATIQKLEEIQKKKKQPSDKKHKCELCDYRSYNPSSIKRHVDGVHLKIRHCKCNFCDYTARSQTTVNKHMKAIHLKIKNFKCDLCDYTASEKAYLQRHMNCVHLKLKIFKCPLCSHTTSLKCSLKKHISSIHVKKEEKPKLIVFKPAVRKKPTQLKEYQCQFCDFSTMKKKYLTSHVQHIHETSKNHKCDYCEYNAPRISTIRTHMEAVHLKIKRFQCDICEYRTTRPTLLRCHIKAIHMKKANTELPFTKATNIVLEK